MRTQSCFTRKHCCLIYTSVWKLSVMLYKECAFLSLMCLSKCVLSGNYCLNTGLPLKLSDQIANDYLLVKAVISASLADCASSCGLKWKCTSFFYHLTTKACRHYSGKISALNLNSETGWAGYQIEGRPLQKMMSLCTASEGYVFHTDSNMCYKLHTDPLTWIQARDVCLQEGADMIMLNTDAKKDLIERIVSADGQNEYSIGATDAATEGEWRWSADNSVIPWFNKVGLGAECMEIEATLVYDDTACNSELQKYFCEKFL